MAGVPTLYDMTPLTRDAETKRRVVVQGWDIDRRIFLTFLAGLFPAFVVGMVFSRFIGPYAIFPVALVYLSLFWLLLGRSKYGLELANWRNLFEKKRSNAGYFILRGKRVDPERNQPRMLRSASVPGAGLLALQTTTVNDADDLFA